MRSMELSIFRCDNTTNSSIPCANDTMLNNLFNSFFGNFIVNLVFINPLINPGNTEYLDYYLDDTHFFTFSQTQGSYSIGLVEDYAIDTD